MKPKRIEIKATGMSTFYTRPSEYAPWETTGINVHVDVIRDTVTWRYTVRMFHASWTWRIDLPCGVESAEEARIVAALAEWMDAATREGRWNILPGEEYAEHLAERCGVPYSLTTAAAVAQWRLTEMEDAERRRQSVA